MIPPIYAWIMNQRSTVNVWTLFLVLVLAPIQALAQVSESLNPAVLSQDTVQARIAEQVVRYPQDKIYLHTDRSHYVVGESVWFRVHVVDAVLHTPVSRQDYVFVELINEADSILKRLRIRETDAAFSGVLHLPLSLPEGTYVLRAYTGQLRNMDAGYFFHKKINVYAPMSGSNSGMSHQVSRGDGLLHIDFFPEGGHLIEGAPNRIAFKATWQDGRPAYVEGQLMDDDGLTYGSVRTLYEGMGLMQLTPLPGKHYHLVFDETVAGGEGRFALPVGTSETYGLRAELVDEELLVTVLHGSGWDQDASLYILVHTRGMVHYWLPWDMDYRTMAFDIKDLPSGVTQILLFDGEGRAVSDRLVFLNHAEDKSMIDLEIAKTTTQEEELVRVALTFKDAVGNPLKGDFSVSVVDNQFSLHGAGGDVFSTLLLDSELKGYIAHPGYYLERGREAELDILMMIHGWKRYAIPKVLAKQYAHPTVPVGVGMAIRGWVEQASGRPAKGSTVSMLSWEGGFSEEVLTGEDGRFAFTGFEAPDSLSFVIQAKPARGRNDLVVHIDPEKFPPMTTLAGMFSQQARATGVQDLNAGLAGLRGEEGRLRQALLEKHTMVADGDTLMRRIDIEEVSVEVRREPAQAANYSFYMPTDRRNVLTAEQLEEIQPQTISDALRHIPFITVQEDTSGQRKVYIGRMRNNSMMAATSGLGQPAVVVIDDMIIQDYDLDMLMDPSNIDKIGVLQGTAAMLLGGQGVGGAIVITTKKGLPASALNQSSNSLKLVTPLGYQPPVEFYVPYSGSEANDLSMPHDALQPTLYWNPAIRLNEQGEADFEFYIPRHLAEKGLRYQIMIEGIAEDGTIIHRVDQQP